MEFTEILNYLYNPGLPIVVLVVVCAVIYGLYKSERKKHAETRQRLDEVYTRLENRLYHELDELEKLLREERAAK